jgi:hypothetical protein
VAVFHRELGPHGARCRKAVSGGMLELRRGKSFLPLRRGWSLSGGQATAKADGPH